MQNQNENQTDNTDPVVAPTTNVSAQNNSQDDAPVSGANQPSVEDLIDDVPDPVSPDSSDGIMSDVIDRLNDAHNVLIALSSNPTVDDLAAAIGLSLCLDRIGKRVTTIYSGATPNVLEFLSPEDTFESTTDTLQDFVITLDKEKADHLRYKLDGEYVKIFITPYRTRISEDDLEFTYGDYNVDLVIALNVKDSTDLDSALREQGRVMHDAKIINIAIDEPSKFGEIKWSNQDASSVSEMVAKLLYAIDGKITTEEATALLTGIIAATDRFSSDNTTPETMQTASRLMASGADQKLIIDNIADSRQTNPANLGSNDKSQDLAALDIEHKEEAPKEKTEEKVDDKTEEQNKPEDGDASATKVEESSKEETPKEKTVPESEEPKPEEPEPTVPPLDLVTEPLPTPAPESSAESDSSDLVLPKPTNFEAETKTEKVVSPNAEFVASVEEGTNKYGQMLEAALNEFNDTPTVTPEQSAPAIGESIEPEPIASPAPPISAPINPAASVTPPVSEKPEINGVPEINYMPMPGDEVLPPPPTPPIDSMGSMPPVSEMPPAPVATAPVASDSTTPTMPAPTMSMPDPISPTPADQTNPAPADPSAFKIP